MPGGNVPPIRHDAMLMVSVTVNAIGAAGWPAVIATGLGVDATSVVAPASEFTAPNAPSVAIADFKTAPSGEPAKKATVPSTRRSAGVRCNNEINTTAESRLRSQQGRSEWERMFMVWDRLKKSRLAGVPGEGPKKIDLQRPDEVRRAEVDVTRAGEPRRSYALARIVVRLRVAAHAVRL